MSMCHILLCNFVSQDLKNKVNLKVTDLDAFKLVMTTITNILHMSVSAELQYLQFQETFHILRGHQLPVLSNLQH